MHHDKPPRKWVTRFLLKHSDWHQPPAGSWPEIGSTEMTEFEHIWDDAFQSKNVQQDQAYAASKRLLQAMDRPRFRNDHLPAILNAIEEMRAENYAQGESLAGLTDREQAQANSRNCEICFGNGITAVYHPRYDGTRYVRLIVIDRGDGYMPDVLRQLGPTEDAGEINAQAGEKLIRQPGVTSATCVCDYGRWLKQYYDADREMKGRFVDLEEVRGGRSRWLEHAPSRGNEKNSRVQVAGVHRESTY